MKSKFDLVSILLVNIDGKSPVPTVKKRKAKEVFAKGMLAKNTLMLKSTYQLLKEVSHNYHSNFSCFLYQGCIPFL